VTFNLVPDLGAIVDRYWGVHPTPSSFGPFTEIARDVTTVSGEYFRLKNPRGWWACKPDNEEERLCLRMFWEALCARLH